MCCRYSSDFAEFGDIGYAFVIQVLGHVEDRRKRRKLPKKQKSPKKSKKKQKAALEKVLPKIPATAVPIRPAMIYQGEGRARRNVERKNYAEPTYFWEPPPLPSHIEKPKPLPEKKKKNVVANPPNEKLFIITHLRDDSTRVRLHQSKLCNRPHRFTFCARKKYHYC